MKQFLFIIFSFLFSISLLAKSPNVENSDSINNKYSTNYNQSSDNEEYYADDDIDYYLAETKIKSSLFENKKGKGKRVAIIPMNQYVLVSSADKGEKYRKVVYLDKDLDGYVLAANLKNFSKIETDEDGGLKVETITYSKTASINITNNTNYNTRIDIGGKTYRFKAHEKRTITDIKPGTYKTVASSQGVKPFVAKDKFEAGYVYSWEFYISY